MFDTLGLLKTATNKQVWHRYFELCRCYLKLSAKNSLQKMRRQYLLRDLHVPLSLVISRVQMQTPQVRSYAWWSLSWNHFTSKTLELTDVYQPPSLGAPAEPPAQLSFREWQFIDHKSLHFVRDFQLEAPFWLPEVHTMSRITAWRWVDFESKVLQLASCHFMSLELFDLLVSNIAQQVLF